MPMPTTQPVARVRVFVDYWNYHLAMRSHERGFKTDWRVLGPQLAAAAAERAGSIGAHVFQGLNVYSSYDPFQEESMKHQAWAQNVVSRFPGVFVSMSQRQQKKNGPYCPACHLEVKRCPQCEQSMRGSEEKDVDIRMAADMLYLAWEGNYDIGVLVSSDNDFVPVATHLSQKGVKVIHGALRSRRQELTKHCWGHINLYKIREQFRLAT